MLRMFEVQGRKNVFHKKTPAKRKNSAQCVRCGSDQNGFGQLTVNIVATVLDGHGVAAFAPGYYGNGLAAVTSQGEKECI